MLLSTELAKVATKSGTELFYYIFNIWAVFALVFPFFCCMNQLVEKLHEKWDSGKEKPYPAMYSSVFGGIILDPAMMVIPIDDHMVHRGHGVFDTSIILNG